MEDEKEKEKNAILLICFVVVQIALVVLFASSLSKLFSSNEIEFDNIDERPKINIEGLNGTMPDASDDDVMMIGLAVLDAISDNQGDVNFGANKGLLRNGSVKTYYFEDVNVHYYSAIVDIPGLEQSYWIFHEYSDDKTNGNVSVEDQYLALCLANNEKKVYPNFDCKSSYGNLTYNAIAAKYLRYMKLYEDDIELEVSDDLKSIEIGVMGERKKDDEEYINLVKGKIESLGIDSGLFEYTVVDSSTPNYVHKMEKLLGV